MRGFTLVEVLVALVVASVLIAGVLSVAVAGRASHDVDRGRAELNHTLRSALDLLGAEIRRGGERLPAGFPAVEILDGADGAPDTLVVRRNALDEVLPVCAPLARGTVDTAIRIADARPSAPRGCRPTPGMLDAWRALRGSGRVEAYVYNPVSRQGEWFAYDHDGPGDDVIGRGPAPWGLDCDPVDQCRVYALEERRFEIDGGLLTCVTNDVDDRPTRLVADLVDFQLRASLDGGATSAALGPADDWSRIRAVDVTVTGRMVVDGRDLTRSQSARFLPRNVLSR